MVIMVIVILAAAGLVMGSFVHALVWRFRQQELISRKSESRKSKVGTDGSKAAELTARDLSMLTGRSMCSHCHHPLVAKDLIPVVSWLMLGGRCRYCRRKIEDVPIIEIGMAALFVGSYIWWPYGFGMQGMIDFGFWLVFLVGFMALADYDGRWSLLPDRIVFPLIGLAVVKVLVAVLLFGGGWYAVWQAVLAVGCIAGLFYVLHAVSRGGWIGFGDVKLGIVLGLLAGEPSQAVLVLFLASSLGTLAAIPFVLQSRPSPGARIPFGPFLLAAMIIVVLFGGSIIQWYARLANI